MASHLSMRQYCFIDNTLSLRREKLSQPVIMKLWDVISDDLYEFLVNDLQQVCQSS